MKQAALALALALAACGDDDAAGTPDAAPPLGEVTDPLEYVDPTIGTGGFGFAHGSAFVGATAPHGLCKLGPDTRGPHGTVNFLHYSGYWAGDHTIQGFSHLHLHGTGATDYGVISVMPTTAFAAASTSVVDYEQRFEKADELARPGRYAVTLADGTHVELTAAPSGAERLAGGNVLVCEGAPGRLFEVTRAGEVVWEWISPFTNRSPHGALINWLFRAHRFGIDHPALAGKELDPERYRELNRMYGLA